jgi:hypothetical protein
MEYLFIFAGFIVVVAMLARIATLLKNQAREINFLSACVRLLLDKGKEGTKGTEGTR